MTKIKNLPLHDLHVRNSARFTDFAGWNMPVSYGSSVEEHINTRNKASLFDVSHMGEILVFGQDASAFLDHILTNSVQNIENGQAVYSPICFEDGGTVDDLIVYKKGDFEFLLCVNASNITKDFNYLLEHKCSYKCEIQDLSDEYAQLAIQGPLSQDILSTVLDYDLSHIAKMCFIDQGFKLTEAIIARTGYTGEVGFEIYCKLEKINFFIDSFRHYVNKGDLKWAGLAARDSLRLEAGYPLYGNELSDEISPLQAGLNWAISWDKQNFIGRESLLDQKDKGISPKILFYETENRRTPRDGDQVFFEGKPSGRVLSGGYSPVLRKPIGSMLVESNFIKETKNSGWTIKVRNTNININVTTPVLKRINKN